MTDQHWQTGLAQLESGRYREAAESFQAVLAERPDDPPALYRLGTAMGRLGHRDLELQLVGQAIARAPTNAEYHCTLGEGLLATGYPGDAADAFREVLRLDPDASDAVAGLADACLDLGLVDDARGFVATKLAVDLPRSHRPIGRLALVDGRMNDAVEHLMIHLGARSDDAPALFYLGVALHRLELLEAAAESYRQAIAIDPSLFEAVTNLGTLLLASGRADEALVFASHALQLAPGRPGAWLNRGNAHRDRGDLSAAASDYRQAVQLDPGYAEAWSSLGNLYHDLAEWSLALDAHARAVDLGPNIPQVRWNRSFTLLATGDLENGWRDYESRLRTEAACPEPRDFSWEAWTGESLVGKRILVWREQGLGDELMFAAALPMLLERRARVTLLASPRLRSLLARAFPGADVRADGDPAAIAAREFDYQVPLGSLPLHLGLVRGDFDRLAPFLLPEPTALAKWRARLAALGDGPKVGVCWRSGLLTPERQRHYAPLQAWKPVFLTQGVTFVNLQYDDCRVELTAMERDWGVRVHQWAGEDLKEDLESVVGLLATLDAVVSAPTAVSSLAGAVGVRTWQIDSGSDWTAFGEARSPWFPRIELLQKRTADPDWGPVMDAAADRLRGLVGGSLAPQVFDRGADNLG